MSAGPAQTPAASRSTERALRWSLLGSASVSLAALVAHVFKVLPMPFFLEVFGVPSLLVIYALAAYAKKINARMLTNGLWVGLWAGLNQVCWSRAEKKERGRACSTP